MQLLSKPCNCIALASDSLGSLPHWQDDYIEKMHKQDQYQLAKSKRCIILYILAKNTQYNFFVMSIVQGSSMLLIAIEYHNHEVVEELLKMGANPDLPNEQVKRSGSN